MKIEHIYTIPTTHASKYIIDGRFNVYLNPFSKNLEAVIDNTTGENITDTIKGMELIVAAYNQRRNEL